MHTKSLQSCQLFVTPWTVVCQAPLSMGFSRHEYWSGLPFPLSGYLPDQDIELMSPAAPELAGGFFTTEPPEKPKFQYILGGKSSFKFFFFFKFWLTQYIF